MRSIQVSMLFKNRPDRAIDGEQNAIIASRQA